MTPSWARVWEPFLREGRFSILSHPIFLNQLLCLTLRSCCPRTPTLTQV